MPNRDDVYTLLRDSLQKHGNAVDREGVKKWACMYMYSGVMPARETFVVGEWAKTIR